MLNTVLATLAFAIAALAPVAPAQDQVGTVRVSQETNVTSYPVRVSDFGRADWWAPHHQYAWHAVISAGELDVIVRPTWMDRNANGRIDLEDGEVHVGAVFFNGHMQKAGRPPTWRGDIELELAGMRTSALEVHIHDGCGWPLWLGETLPILGGPALPDGRWSVWRDRTPRVGQQGSPGALPLEHEESALLHDHRRAREPVLATLRHNALQTLTLRRAFYLGTEAGAPDLDRADAGGLAVYKADFYGDRVGAPAVQRVMYDGTEVIVGQVTTQDWQHAFRPLRHIAAAVTTGDQVEYLAGVGLVNAIRGSKLSAPAWHGDPGFLEDSARALAWGLLVLATCQDQFGFGADAADVPLRMVEAQASLAHPGPRPMPALVLNQAGFGQADHHHMRKQGFQELLLVNAIAFMVESGVHESRARALMPIAVASYLDMQLPNGRFYKDADPVTEPHYWPDGGTNITGTAVWSLGAGVRLLRLDPGVIPVEDRNEILERLRAAYDASSQARLGNNLFNGGVALGLYEQLGYWRQ